MKKCSQQQVTQLSFNFECCTVSNSENKQSAVSLSASYHRFTKAEIEEAMAIENDLISGRGAWLYQQLERSFAHERKVAQAMREFEALSAEAYKYNF